MERQRVDCEALCVARGWEVAEVFEDNDASAYGRRPRRAYERMLAAVDSGAIGAIVTWHNDRLHRSPKELEAFIDLVERSGVRLAVVAGGDYDLTTPDGRLSARIVGAVARKESEDRSRRVRRKHLERLKGASNGTCRRGRKSPPGTPVPLMITGRAGRPARCSFGVRYASRSRTHLINRADLVCCSLTTSSRAAARLSRVVRV